MLRLSLQFSFESAYYEYHLPAVDNRRMSLDMGSMLGQGLDQATLSLEVWDGEWRILPGKDATLFQKGELQQQISLLPGILINGKLSDGTLFAILPASVGGSGRVFHKYGLSGIKEILIGRDTSCEVSINDSFVSKNHVRLRLNGQNCVAEDLSTNGAYLNNRRIAGSSPVNKFDLLHIAGRKVLFLGDALAISGDNIAVRLPKYDYRALDAASTQDKPLHDQGFFSRAPRDMEPTDEESVEIEAPPAPARNKPTPLLFIVGPSVTMPLPILASMLLNMSMLNNGASNPSMYLVTGVSVAMSAGLGAFWAIANQRYNRKSNQLEEEHRVYAYQTYIGKTERLLKDKHGQNVALLRQQFLSTTDVLSAVVPGNRKLLWNRNVHHKDFLTVRIGNGQLSMKHTMLVPKERFSLVDDRLQDEPFVLRDKYRNLQNVPKLLSLCADKLVGVTGDDQSMAAFSRVLATQIAFTHCYTDVRMVFLYDGRQIDELRWIRWLPHVFTADRKLRMAATGSLEIQEILYHLTNEMRSRASGERVATESGWLPHYVLFVSDPAMIEDDPVYKYISDDKDYGITVVFLYGETDKLPNEVKRVVQCDKEKSRLYSLDEAKIETDFFTPDDLDAGKAEAFARELCGIFVREIAAEGEIPQGVGFLEMLGVPNVESIPILRMWKENRTYESMKALVGYRSNSIPMYLDIHEKQHGPHGLVAGTTGSGKSETLQTYILSMMLSYHPDEAAFILIDYKGGGMANIFAGTPHLAGTITNLDGIQTRRALVSIKSEIRRRQAAFNQAQVNHIDMYARLYREGKVAIPLPHLIIIADEFAELKREQPEFIKELVSTARVGRSLGIHLILATQKPSGVVDDEIWSNSRFRLCLKVQDRQDSSEMLHRPDAAYLVNPGRAYLQVGNDEIFELFQSGYSGAEYVSRDRIVNAKDNVVMMIDRIGRSSVVRSRKKKNSDAITEIQACVNAIVQTAAQNNVRPALPLWLPALPDTIRLGDIACKQPEGAGLNAVLGIVDDPEKQKQYPLVVDFIEKGNLLIVGNSGSGKSIAVQTMLCSLVRQYGCEELNVYILDFSSRIHVIFSALPHVGGVIYAGDGERLKRLFSYFDQEIAKRNVFLEQHHVGSYAEYRKVSDHALPAIILVLDNYSAFNDLYSDYEDQLIKFTREGRKFGIFTVLTNSHAGGVKYKLRQNFDHSIALHLGERTDYMDVFGRAPEYSPDPHKGRGLILDGELLEMQIAVAGEGENDYQRNRNLIEEFTGIAAAYRGIGAYRIPSIPRSQTQREFLESEEARRMLGGGGAMPLGYDFENAEVVGIDLCATYCYTITDSSGRGGAMLLGNIARTAYQLSAGLLFACRAPNEISDELAADGLRVFSGPDGLLELFMLLRGEFEARSKYRKELVAAQKKPACLEFITGRFRPVFVLIEDFGEFLEILYTDAEPAVRENAEMFFKGGAGLGVYFFAVIPESMEQAYSLAFRNFASHKTGLHLGGKSSQQKLFDFDFSMSQQMKAEEYNVAYIKQKSGTSKVFIPVPHQE